MKTEMGAWISGVAGACALATAGMWYWGSWDGGLSVPPLPQGDMMDIGQLMGIAVLGVTFQFGTPALCVPAWALGLKAKGHWAAKAGMAMAGAAMVMYAFYVRACLGVVAG